MLDSHTAAGAPVQRMLAPVALALAFAFGAPAVAANSFFAVVPVSGVGAGEQLRPVKIALAGAAPPAAHVGEPYEFNLGALLSLDGPEGTEPGKVTWSVVSGSLPAGLTLVGDRVVGTPTELAPGRQVVIQAEHPSSQGTVGAMAGYAFEVAGIPLKNFGSYRAWEDGTYAQSCEAYVRSGDPMRPYVGATGNGVYRILLAGAPVDVYCDQTTTGGGWMRIAFYNQSVTSSSSALSNPSPTANWQMPESAVPNFTSTQKLAKLPTLNAWIAYPNAPAGNVSYGISGSFTSYAQSRLTYKWSHPTQGSGPWRVTEIPISVSGFDYCGTGASSTVLMSDNPGDGTYPGIQLFQNACDSHKYRKQDVPLEIYSR